LVVRYYFVRIGALGEIRVASALAPLVRGQQVVVRSPRGIEIAETVSECRRVESIDPTGTKQPFRIMRPVNHADRSLVERLGRYKRRAVEACQRRLAEIDSQSVLLDIDQMLDGGTLVMHFLGDPDPVAKRIADEIAEQYESIVRSRHLSELLQEGCGDGCGSSSGSGCGSSCGSCSSCH
jgi:hypothetical protein